LFGAKIGKKLHVSAVENISQKTNKFMWTRLFQNNLSKYCSVQIAPMLPLTWVAQHFPTFPTSLPFSIVEALAVGSVELWKSKFSFVVGHGFVADVTVKL
jgi:hypothetical protein